MEGYAENDVRSSRNVAMTITVWKFYGIGGHEAMDERSTCYQYWATWFASGSCSKGLDW